MKGAADLNRDGIVTRQELYEYVEQQVSRESPSAGEWQSASGDYSKHEITAKSRQFGIHAVYVERDYVFGHVSEYLSLGLAGVETDLRLMTSAIRDPLAEVRIGPTLHGLQRMPFWTLRYCHEMIE